MSYLQHRRLGLVKRSSKARSGHCGPTAGTAKGGTAPLAPSPLLCQVLSQARKSLQELENTKGIFPREKCSRFSKRKLILEIIAQPFQAVFRWSCQPSIHLCYSERCFLKPIQSKLFPTSAAAAAQPSAPCLLHPAQPLHADRQTDRPT